MKREKQWNRFAKMHEAHYKDSEERVSAKIVFPRILEKIGSVKGKKILDFGCGQGRFSRSLQDLGAIVTAYDEAAEQVKIAEKQDGGRGILYTNRKEKALLEKSYDITLCFMVMVCNNSRETKKIVEEIYNSLKENGNAVFVNTNTETLGKKFMDFYSILPKKIMQEGAQYKTIIPTSKGNILAKDHYYSKKFLRKLFMQAGFKTSFEETIAEQFALHIVSK